MKLKRLFSAILAVVMVGYNLGGVIPVMADTDDPTIQNPDPVTLDDGVVLSKTVRSVPGYANKWEVTLRIESPKTEKTSDTVIVIDRSGSMGNNGRLTAAKAAARSLAQQLLPEGNTTNRVGVVSFASSASNSGTGTGFTDNYNTVSNAIGRMSASGGTYTQSAIHMAAEMLSNSTADIKTMIILSDGEPTYSVPFTNSARNNDDNFVAYGNALETSSEVDQSVFSYSATGRVGSGSDLRQCMEYEYGRCVKYYNNGNSAIAEAGYYKAGGGTIYTIALEAGDVGTPILNAIASPDKHYTATPDELTQIFNDIAGSILSLIQTASVEDTMGHGVTVSGTDGETSLEWEPEFEYDKEKGVFVAETSYEVEMNEDVYDQTATGGFYALNESAILTYNDGQTGEFPIPKAKPFDLDVEKVLTVDGEEKTGEEFEFTISGNGATNTYSVKSGEEHIVPVPMPIKISEEYTVTEIGVGEDSEIPFEYYDAPEYTVKYNGVESETNKFVITEQHGDVIDIVIKNNYETTSVDVSKVWDDDDDRDNLRKNYADLFVAVKDGNKYVAYEALDLTGNKDYSFEGLPKNRNGSAINYTVVEARGCSESSETITCSSEFNGDDDYTMTNVDGVITNKHIPKTVTLTIKKKWDTSAGTLPTATPGFVTVEVSNDKNDTVKTVTLQGEAYNEWTGTFEGYMYEKGEKITYTVKEKEIGDGGVLNSDDTLYVYEDDVLEGKWVATHNGAEVTNTWTPAKTVYTGAGEFYIEKTDQDGETLSGVTFTVGDKTYTTGSDGRVKVEFSKSVEKPENKYTFNITETDAPEYYDIIEGTEVLEATTRLKNNANEESLTNTFTKSFKFAVKTAVDGYVWQGDDLTLLVTDQALADELKIEKTFEGISAEAFEEKSQIKFTITGPDGFDEMTVGNGDDECKVSGSKLTCIIDGSDVLLPVGEYTVTESDADIENFTYTSEPSSKEIKKTVELGGTAEFKFKNVYESVKTASFKVKKVWEDDDDRDGVRPDTLEVTLLADDEAYGDPIKLKGDDWEYEWTELPLVNEDAEEIVYSAEEEDLGDDYESDGGVMKDGVFTFTNTHKPETKKIKIKKIWDTSAGNLPTTNPKIITVILSNDKDSEAQTITLEGNDYGEWESDEIEVLVYANQGETITYSVSETEIDGNELIGGNKDTYYVYSGDVLEGKWVAEGDALEVTNTWTPAKTVYTGAGEFYIEKTDQDSETLSGVTFTVGDKEYTTGSDGKVKVEFSKSDEEPEDKYTFEITETDAPEYYDVIEGTEVLEATTDMELTVDKESMTNTYVKSFTFEVKTAVDGYNWQGDDLTLLVTDQALADELRIEKTFEGISAEAFEENSEIEFTISGPEGFEEMTVGIGDDECEISGSKLVCVIDGTDVLLPIGEYTVTESNADIENFTYTSEPTSGEVKKTVELGETAEFEFKNIYESVKTASFKVKKVWEDDGDRDGVRPDTLEVTLLADDEAYGDPIKLKGDDWEYEWTELPLVNEDAEEIVYSAEEEDLGDDYESDGGVMKDGVFTFTNTHEPETVTLTIIKKWDTSAGTLPTVTPAFVEVLLSNDKNDEVKTVRLEGDDYAEWNSTFDVYENEGGEKITYSVTESKIGDDAFDEGETTLYIYNGDILEGKWVAEVSDFEVTNTWTPAKSKYIYDGESKFEIVKVDEDDEAMSGVVFTIGDTDKTTDGNGKITMDVPISEDMAEQTIEYTISEKETLEGYDLVEGSATVTVSCTSKFKEADKENMVNKYTKTCTYEKEGDDEFVWNGNDLTLTVTNLRSLAGSLTIIKNFSGVEAEKLEGLTFTISGPEDFGENGEMELSFSDDCVVDGSTAICEVEGRVPTGEYTVSENNAKIDNYTLTVTGDGESQQVEKDDDAVFEITNEYEIIDPCAAEGGCGGDVPPVETPETGRVTSHNSSAAEAAWASNMIGGAVVVMLGVSLFALGKRKEAKLTK